MPRQSFGGQFLHGDLFEMAAAYALRDLPGLAWTIFASTPRRPTK
jgi:hypothetical protein